jgi:hypothetical protein
LDANLSSLLSLTSADKRFMDEVAKYVTGTWTDTDDPTAKEHLEYEGSDEHLRSQFETYLHLLMTTMHGYTENMTEQQKGPHKDLLNDFK